MELQVSDILRIIKKRLSFIMCLTVIAVAGTAWLSFYILTPQYKATTTLLVWPNHNNEINYYDLINNEKIAPTLSLIGKSKKIASEVIVSLKMNISEDQLLKKIEVKELGNSLATKITVTDPDPSQVVLIANSFAESLKNNLPGIMPGGYISILDKAELEEKPKPVSPKPYFNIAVVFLFAFNMGIGIALLREAMDKTVKREETLNKLLNLPLLGTLLKYDNKRLNKSVLFCLKEPNSSNAEAFRKLRTSIQYMKGNQAISTLLITSPLPKEGKTFTAANLGVAMAQEGKQVLLLDCNLRNPFLHLLFDIPNEHGLTNLLINEISIENTIFPTEQDNLYILPGGSVPPNPSELLGSPAMAELLESLRQRYDIILMDSLPVIPVTDTQVLARFSDAVVLIAKVGVTLCDSVIEAVNMLDFVGANVIGTVANYKIVKDKKLSQYQYNAESKLLPVVERMK